MGLFGDLLNNVNNLINLTNVFGGDSNRSYPSTLPGKKGGSNTANINTVTNYIKDYGNKDWQSSRGYSFQVFRVLKGEGGTEVQKPEDGWTEFRLQINPQELDQDEIFAIEVTPTLRGILVEHHGTILKDITISGTTGISPLRREGGANTKTGAPILQSGHSGFQEFHELRSLFRAYVEAKRLDQRENGELRMVFSNYKDQEFLYVEPQKFTMKRSSARPMLYDYTISMKGVGYANNPAPPIPTLFGKIDAVLSSVQDYITLAVQVMNGGLGIINRTERQVASTIIAPLVSINQAVLAIRGGQATLLGQNGITRGFIDSVSSEIDRVGANLNEVFGRDMTNYNKISGRTPTLVGTPTTQSTYQQLQILNAFGKAKQALLLLSSQQQLFDQNVFDVNKNVVSVYGNKVSLQEPGSVRQAIILSDDNVQSIAMRELGDVDRFRDIVILNNLKPPYIDPAGGLGVLKPGDRILIPQLQSSIPMGTMKNKTYNITRNMSETEAALGVDIRLTKDGDLAISNTGDLSLVAGLQNMAQAVVTKLFLEVGGLKRHPSIGTNMDIGSKVTSQFLAKLQSRILDTFSQDPRIEQIPYINLVQNGGTTTINMIIKLRNVEQPVPLPITLNAG